MNHLLKVLILTICLLFTAGIAEAGSITLTCDPPIYNTDGSLLTDLAGYIIYYGNASGDYSTEVSFSSEPIFYIPDLVEGQIYYFAGIAFNTLGNESELSNEYSVFIPFVIPEPPTNCRVQ